MEILSTTTAPAMSDNSSPFKFRLTPKNFIYVTAANTLIAVFIFMTAPGNVLLMNFIYSQCIGISIASAVAAVVRFFRTTSLVLQIIIITLAVITGAAAGVAVATLAAGLIAHALDLPAAPQDALRSFFPNMLYGLLFGSVISYVFISLKKISDEKIRRLEVEKTAAVTEIRLLQSQMEPHFLFNTLSTILSLIDRDPEKAKGMLESFTLFLRASLVTARNETITLSQEMDVVKNYLDIFKVRMGDRLRYAIDIPDDLQGARVPPLIIQPLVENALKHGLEPSVSGGQLLVKGQRLGDIIRIVVADSGTGISETGHGNGIGLDNIKKRLDLMYQGRGRMFFEETSPSGLKAVIEVPYETD